MLVISIGLGPSVREWNLRKFYSPRPVEIFTSLCPMFSCLLLRWVYDYVLLRACTT